MQKYILTLLFISICTQFSFAQEDQNIGTEVVNVVKPYSPSVSDAFKIKEKPVVNDSTDLKKKSVNYTISSIPVASTFIPAKGKSAKVKKQKPKKLYNNYASFGIGNYLNVLADFYATIPINRNENFNLGLNHHSTQGEIKEVQLDNKLYDTNLNATYSKNTKNFNYTIGGLFKHQLYNWFGTSYNLTDAERANINPAHTYLTSGLNGSITMKNSVFKNANMEYRRFWDNQNATENYLKITPNFEFEIENYILNVLTTVEYLGGEFNLKAANSEYNHMHIGIQPNYEYILNDLTLNIGFESVLAINSSENETNLYVFPKINATYNLIENHLTLLAGINGDLNMNTYYNFAQQNPYLLPLLNIEDTKNNINAHFGFTGNVANTVSFFVKGFYSVEKDRALFTMNPVNDVNLVTENYLKVNTFNVIYDDVNTLGFTGKIEAEVVKNYNLGVSITYENFSIANENEVWNTPNLTATAFGKFKFTDKISGRVDVFYIGERKDRLQSNTNLVAPALAILDDYLDVNINIEYQLTNRFSVFLKGRNLASENYQRYLSYPVQQLQVLGGMTYKFDF